MGDLFVLVGEACPFSTEFRFGHLNCGHSNLFRISIFEFLCVRTRRARNMDLTPLRRRNRDLTALRREPAKPLRSCFSRGETKQRRLTPLIGPPLIGP
jgi:hypothetical protein